MRQMLGIALVLAVAGCRGPAEPRLVSVEVSSPADVTLRIGQAVRVDGKLRATFIGVPADSRCPATAECIWAGDAAVAITSSTGTGSSCPDTLHTANPTLALCGNYLISLLELTPYPQVPGQIPPGVYEARLRFSTGDPP